MGNRHRKRRLQLREHSSRCAREMIIRLANFRQRCDHEIESRLRHLLG